MPTPCGAQPADPGLTMTHTQPQFLFVQAKDFKGNTLQSAMNPVAGRETRAFFF